MENTREAFPVINKNTKMNNEPKNILPNATIVPDNSFKTYLAKTFSAAHKTVAIKIKTMPKDRLKSGIIMK